MYIEPNTTIWICKNVPLDPSYDHTIYWTGVDDAAKKLAQENYFKSKAKYTITDNTYARVQRGVLRIDKKAEDLYDCNYLMFQNTNFPPTGGVAKYFYAFIKGVEYANNGMSLVSFELDVMQTWYFNYELEQCFVDREHAASDELFENIVEENLNIGELYTIDTATDFSMNDMNLCMMITRKLTGSPSTPAPLPLIVNNIIMPMRVDYRTPVLPSSLYGIQEKLDAVQEDEILCIYQYPAFLVSAQPEFPNIHVAGGYISGATEIAFTGDTVEANELANYMIRFSNDTHDYFVVSNTSNVMVIQPPLIDEIEHNAQIIKASDAPVPATVETKNITLNASIDGYTPKNKKLFSSPFNKLIVSNNCGQTAEYLWEYFNLNSQLQTEFKFSGSIISTPSVLCYPSNYRGKVNDFDSGIQYTDFPQCCWSGDTFKAWWAQTKASFGMGTFASILSALSGGIAGKAATNMASSFLSNGAQQALSAAAGTVAAVKTAVDVGLAVANAVAKVTDIKNTPSQTHGQIQCDSLNPALRKVKYTFYNVCIKAQYARIIDEYFDRYGYATKRNKIPNRNARELWTYTKTIGCTLKGSVPADDISSICEIYNRGITFWNDPTKVGDYTQSNRPISELS